MTIKVYGAVRSGGVARVVTTLLEKDVKDWTLVEVKVKEGENRKPEFLAMQPFGQIPVIDDDGFVLFGKHFESDTPLHGCESRAVARYIADKYKDQGSQLYGSSDKSRALVEQWLEVESQNFNPAHTGIAIELLYKKFRGLGEPDMAVVEANLTKLKAVLDVYEEHLSKSKYLAGDFYSLADLTHFHSMQTLHQYLKQAELITSRPHVNAWYESIKSRPATQELLKRIEN